MSLIINTLSVISTIVVLYLTIDFLWKILAKYISFLGKDIINDIPLHRIFSITTTCLFFNLLDVSFYSPW